MQRLCKRAVASPRRISYSFSSRGLQASTTGVAAVRRSVERLFASSYASDVTKLGGVIGFVIGFLLSFIIGDHIDVLADNNSALSDYIATAVGIAVGVGGAVVGSLTVRRLQTRFGRSHTLAR